MFFFYLYIPVGGKFPAIPSGTRVGTGPVGGLKAAGGKTPGAKMKQKK